MSSFCRYAHPAINPGIKMIRNRNEGSSHNILLIRRRSPLDPNSLGEPLSPSLKEFIEVRAQVVRLLPSLPLRYKCLPLISSVFRSIQERLCS